MTSAILATLSDVVGFLAQSFRLAAVFPAFIFVLLNEAFILPHLPQKGIISQVVALDLSDKLWLAAALSLLLGYTLTIINIPLIRLFEGYPWRATLPGIWLTNCQKARRQALEEYVPYMERECDRLKEKAKDYRPHQFRRDWLYRKRKALEERLEAERLLAPLQVDNYFPTETPILPTALGNTIAAFEDYPSTRYHIDAVTLWPRLLPTLTQENYASYVEREKAGLDFALNLCFLLLILSLEAIYVGVILIQEWATWLLGAGAAMILAYFFYQAAITGAFNWGNTVCVAFDLYRYHLLKALYGHPPRSFPAEMKTWERLSRFMRKGMGPPESKDSPERTLTEKDLSRLLHYSRIRREFKRQNSPPDGGKGGK